MASDKVVEITDANFDQEVTESKVPVLVDVGAEWCGPCRMVAPLIDELAEEYAGRVKVGKLDADANHDTALKFGIRSIPTVLLIDNGRLVKQMVGLPNLTRKVLTEALDALL